MVEKMQIQNIEEFHAFLNSGNFNFRESQILSSKKPPECEHEACILGVDEAGRGPVLGPMVYGVAYVPKKKMEDLVAIGCADSKTLTEKKREELFSTLCAADDFVGWTVDVISPNYISNKMLKRVKLSLNEIAQNSTVNLIKNLLSRGINVTEIYVDTVGPPEKYQERLSKIFPSCKVTVAKKADSLYPIVSAASICAKVIRDLTIQNWKFSEDLEFATEGLGSGYPNDPQTKLFLKENMDEVFGFPKLVRFSWSTASKILEKAAEIEWEDEEPLNQKSISKFFNISFIEKPSEMKHEFFKETNLANTNTLY